MGIDVCCINAVLIGMQVRYWGIFMHAGHLLVLSSAQLLGKVCERDA